MNLDEIRDECVAAGAQATVFEGAICPWVEIVTGSFTMILNQTGSASLATNDGGIAINVLDGVEMSVMEIVCRHAAAERVELKAA